MQCRHNLWHVDTRRCWSPPLTPRFDELPARRGRPTPPRPLPAHAPRPTSGSLLPLCCPSPPPSPRSQLFAVRAVDKAREVPCRAAGVLPTPLLSPSRCRGSPNAALDPLSTGSPGCVRWLVGLNPQARRSDGARGCGERSVTLGMGLPMLQPRTAVIFGQDCMS